MPEMQAYKTTERRSETFSYLPPMTPERMRKQITYLIARGWSPRSAFSPNSKPATAPTRATTCA